MKSMAICTACVCLVPASMLSQVHGQDNIALGKPYTMVPAPNDSRSASPDDVTNLTDGQFSSGSFWVQPSTVGWRGPGRVQIEIDLEDHHAISGIAVRSSSGTFTRWPWRMDVLVSVDGRAYYHMGDLVEFSPPPPNRAGMPVHRFETHQLQTHGRYVRLIVHKFNDFFTDEIEVYRGRDAWKDRPPRGERVYFGPDESHYGSAENAGERITRSVQTRLGNDLARAWAQLDTHRDRLPAPIQQRLDTQVRELETKILNLPPVDPRALRHRAFPLNDTHARVFAIHGAIRAALGQPAVTAWGGNRWEFIEPTVLPDNPPVPDLRLTAMRGETRADVVNLTNNTEQAMTVQLSFTDLPGGATPRYMEVRQAGWTDLRENPFGSGHLSHLTVAAVLPEVQPRGGRYHVELPAGMTTQLWIAATPTAEVPAGTHQGRLVIDGPVADVPVRLRVLDMDFPKQTRLAVGGWDYTNEITRDLTQANRQPLIDHLQERWVNAPWAMPSAMPFGTFDNRGRHAQTPSTSNFDAWVARWPDARRYMVLVGAQDNRGFLDPHSLMNRHDRQFTARVATWINFWVEHAGRHGIEPHQLYLLLVDEPTTRQQDEIIMAWSRAIKAAQPQVNIWDDGNRGPYSTDRYHPNAMQALDVITPLRPRYTMQGEFDFWKQQLADGRRMDFYACLDRPRLYDPYAYFLLQAWDAFYLGAEGSFFWSFVDTRGQDGWNEYQRGASSYSPLFLTAERATAGRHMEAIRESAQDYEYLAMLRDAVTELEANGGSETMLRRLRGLLEDGPRRVLTDAGGVSMPMMWQAPLDRTVADQVRIEIGETLEQLATQQQMATTEQRLNREANQLEQRARRAEEAGRIAEAMTLYQQYIDRFAESDRFEQVRDRYQSLRNDPQLTASAEAQREEAAIQQILITAQAYIEAGLDADARTLLRQVITDHPDTPWAEQARTMLER